MFSLVFHFTKFTHCLYRLPCVAALLAAPNDDNTVDVLLRDGRKKILDLRDLP